MIMITRTSKVAAIALAMMAAAGLCKAGEKPNVVLILADDLGYGELGCYGGPLNTPAMDQLAKDGIRCTDGYAAFPVCSPSRAALLTGRYPARIGPKYEEYFGRGVSLDPVKHTTIGQLMKEAGYRTGCFGKWNVSNGDRRPANDYGFDRWIGLHINHDYFTHKLLANGELDMFEDGKPYPDREGTWTDTVIADEAIKFIKAESEEPFFVYLPFQAPHSPFQDPGVLYSEPLEDNWQQRPDEVRPLIDKMIERLDVEVGRVLKALDDLGLAEDTLVILTSDNGGHKGGNVGRNEPLRGAKQELEEGGIRVPLIFRWPGVLAKGAVFSEPIHAMDLTATVAAVGGANHRPDQPLDGIDVLPALKGEAELPSNRPLFFRRFRARSGSYQQSAVRQGDWKYLRSYRGPEKYTEALYNLESDIGETKDLAKGAPEKLNALRGLLAEWELEMSKTAAPLKKK